MKVIKYSDFSNLISVAGNSYILFNEGFVLSNDLKTIEYKTKSSLPMRVTSRPLEFRGKKVYFETPVSISTSTQEVASNRLLDMFDDEEVFISTELKLALLRIEATNNFVNPIVFFKSRYEGRDGAYLSVNLVTEEVAVRLARIKAECTLSNSIVFMDARKKTAEFASHLLQKKWLVDLPFVGEVDYALPFTVLEIEDSIVFPIKVKLGDAENSHLVVLNKQDGTVVRVTLLEGDVCGIYEVGERILVVSNEGAYYIGNDFKSADVETKQLITLSDNGYNLRRKTSQLYPFNGYAIIVFPLCSKVLVIDKNGALISELDAPQGLYPERVTWVKEAPERPFVVFSKFGGAEIHRSAMAEFSIEDAVAGIGFEIEKEPECEVTLLGDGEPGPVLLNLKVDTIDDALRFGEMFAQNKAYELGTTMYNRTDPNPMFNGLVYLQIQSDTIVAEEIEPLLLIMEERFDIWAKKADVHSGDARLLFCGLETGFVTSKVY